MVVFVTPLGKTTLSDEVKSMTFDKLKETFEGKLDYISLANQLGIKPVKKPKFEKPKEEKSKEE